jgi:hypothetical protein
MVRKTTNQPWRNSNMLSVILWSEIPHIVLPRTHKDSDGILTQTMDYQ